MKGLLVLFVGVCLLGCSQATLPTNFLGVWVGIPEYSELGPWGENLNFSISQIDDDGDQWLMRDTFPESLGVGIPGSFQDWYVDEASQSMHYCGCIRDFYTKPAPTSRAYYDITTESDKKMVFCLRDTDKECDTTWELTLKDEDTLVSEYRFPSPIKHLDVTLKRDSPSPLLSREEKKTIQDQSNCHAEIKECLYPTGASPHEKDEIFKANGAVGCPYAGLKHFFGGLLGRKETEKKPKINRPVHPRTGQPMQNCYTFNQVAEYQYSWTYNETEQAIDAMIQMPVADETTFIAFGIAQEWTFPNAPGMNNSDIVMGWADEGCVVSLYSGKEDGAPDVSTDQVILNPSTSYQDGVLTVAYTRPFNTGHHTISPGKMDQVIWSSGPVHPSGGDCNSASWSYHSNVRGRRTIVWDNGPATFDPTMAC